MEISPLGISNHKLGNFSKAGRKQDWWPTELSQSLRVGESPDPVRVQLLLLTTVPGNGDCCGCTGGRWDSGSLMREGKSKSSQKGDTTE